MQNKRAFSFVEIIITVAIVTLLAVVGISYKNGMGDNSSNTKIVSDMSTIENAIISYGTNVKELPLPTGNTNFYSVDKKYTHSYEDDNTFGVYGSITEDTIPKQYLEATPKDPRTNSYYAYGITKHGKEFEVASVQIINEVATTKVVGEYSAEESENDQKSLIREYNGPDFVSDGSTEDFPYSPYDRILTAKVEETPGNWVEYNEGDIIETGAGEEKEIFFSDGSVSILEENSKIKLKELHFNGEDNLGTFVRIGLGAGKIWTKATNLGANSGFEVYTSDTTAAVRGTIFGVGKSSGDYTPTEVVVVIGEIAVFETEIAGVDWDTFTGSIEITEIENDVSYGTSPLKVITNYSDVYVTEQFSRSSSNPDVSAATGPTLSTSQLNTEIQDSLDVEEYEPLVISGPLVEEELIGDKGLCSTFMVPEEGCAQMDEQLELDGYKLVAYAPFNRKKDLHMYGTGTGEFTKKGNVYTNKISNMGRFGNESATTNYYKQEDGTTPSNENTKDLTAFGEIYRESSFVEMDNEHGIVVTKDDSSYLIYDDLDLGDDFAIEMSVYFPTTNPLGTRYLFQIGDYKLYITNDGAINIKNNLSADHRLLNIYDGKMHNIIAIKKGSEYKLIVDGEVVISDLTGDTTSGTRLFIGSRETLLNQINSIINYVKIYK